MDIQSYITFMNSQIFSETNIIIISAILLIIVVGCGIITYMWTNDDDDESELITKVPRNILIYNPELSRQMREEEYEEELEDHPFAPQHFMKQPPKEPINREIVDDNMFASVSKNEEISDLMENSVASSINNNVPPTYIINKQMKKEDMYNMNYNGLIPRPGTSPLQYNSDSSTVSNNFPNYPIAPGAGYPIPITTNIPINSLPISAQHPITNQLPMSTSIPITSQMQISNNIPISSQLPMSLQMPPDEYSENESLHRSSSLSRKRNSDASKSRVTKPIKRSNSQTSFKNDDDSVKLTRGLSLSKSYDEDLVLSTSLSINKSNDDTTGNYKESRKRRPPGRVGPPVVSKQQPTRGILKTKSRYAKYDKTNNDTKDDAKSETDKSINETETKENIELMK